MIIRRTFSICVPLAALAVLFFASRDGLLVPAPRVEALPMPAQPLTFGPASYVEPVLLPAASRRPVEPTAPSSATRPVVIHTRDLNGRPLGEAEVWLRASGTTDADRPLGETDAGGGLSVELPADLEVAVVAYSSRHVPAFGTIPIGQGTLELVLADARSLSGAVRWADGAAAEADVPVLAWPRERTPSASEVAAVLRGGSRPGVHLVTTDPAGRFHIDGLRAVAYTVTAATQGGGALDRTVAGAEDDEVEVEIVPLNALRVELLDADGGPLRAHPRAAGRGKAWRGPTVGHPILTTPRIELALLGCDVEAWAPPLSQTENLLVFRPSQRGRSTAALTYEAEVPGYEPVWCNLAAQPIGSELRTAQLRLSRRVSLWGRLRLRLDCQGMEWLRRTDGHRAWGMVQLRDVEGTHSLTVTLDGPPGEVFELDGLPEGTYSLSLRLLPSDAPRFPARIEEEPVVTIGREVAQARIDVAGFGGVQMLLQRPDGSDYTGSALLRLTNRRDTSTVFASFSGPPYTFPCVEEGEYTVALEGQERHVEECPALTVFVGREQLSVDLLRLD